VFENFPDGVIVAGPEEIVEYANPEARRYTGIEKLVGLKLAEAMPFDDLNGNTWYDSTQPFTGLAIRRRLAEQSWWSETGEEYLVTGSLVRNRPGGAVRMVVASLRSARVRSRLDRERSDLVATVAHELRSPLTGIKGFTATLLTKWDRFSDEQRQFMLETVDADADRLSRLITELLDAARIDSGRMALRREPMAIENLVRQVLTSIGGADTTLSELLHVEGALPQVWGDADRLTQVVTNLIENAQRHGHGLVAIEIRPEQGIEDDGVRVHVLDRGPGIPAESRERIFSRFWRSGPGAGSGLGLFIVRGIVDLHGGHVTVAEATGGGANLSFWLPVAEPAVLANWPSLD
jgi:signal transduction histidine kinase